MTAGAEAMGRDERLLHAYRDGELGRLARWRFERRLAREPALRRELEALESMAELARGVDARAPVPDFWSRIAPDLERIDAEREAAAPGLRIPGLDAWLRPALLATAAAAAVVVAVFVGLRDTGAPALGESIGVVRWIDPGARSVLVLEDEADATIIWVLEGGDEVPRGERRDVV